MINSYHIIIICLSYKHQARINKTPTSWLIVDIFIIQIIKPTLSNIDVELLHIVNVFEQLILQLSWFKLFCNLLTDKLTRAQHDKEIDTSGSIRYKESLYSHSLSILVIANIINIWH